jgi:predicted nucleic acid-binding protein
MRALLDVNVLIALLDAGHVHHAAAGRWLDSHLADGPAAGWASCPLTQNGCLRILSNRAYPRPQPVAAVGGGGAPGPPRGAPPHAAPRVLAG